MKPIVEAFARNESRFRSGESFRVFHGRGGCYPGYQWCNVDFFAPAILITLYQEPPEHWEKELRYFLARQMEKLPIVKVMVQRRYRRLAPTSVLMETEHAPDHVFARRGELKFKLSFTQQNCGFFLDIEPARRWLEENCAGKKVLNLFAYTCAFSVVAMQAGANSVVNIDLSRKSLSIGQANHQLNSVNADGVHFLPHNIFTSWGKLKKLGPYDIVIIDPPTCQKGSFEARGDYPKVLRRMGDLLAEKGTFLACLNAPEIDASSFEKMIGSAVTGYLLNARLLGNPDFPDLKEPSLKMFVYSKQG